MKKTILSTLFAVLLIGTTYSQSVTYSSTPQYNSVPVTSTVETNASFSSTYTPPMFDGGSGMYNNTIYYPSLVSGTVFNIYTSDTFHVYGPYSASNSWSVPYNSSGVSIQATLNENSSGGSFDLYSAQPITLISYQFTKTVIEQQLSGYETTFYYDALSAGTVMDIFTSDTFHVYGPYAASDSWSVPYNSSNVSIQATLNEDSSGGSFVLYNMQPISAATIESVPEPSTYALLGMGAIAMLMVARRKKAA